MRPSLSLSLCECLWTWADAPPLADADIDQPAPDDSPPLMTVAFSLAELSTSASSTHRNVVVRLEIDSARDEEAWQGLCEAVMRWAGKYGFRIKEDGCVHLSLALRRCPRRELTSLLRRYDDEDGTASPKAPAPVELPPAVLPAATEPPSRTTLPPPLPPPAAPYSPSSPLAARSRRIANPTSLSAAVDPARPTAQRLVAALARARRRRRPALVARAPAPAGESLRGALAPRAVERVGHAAAAVRAAQPRAVRHRAQALALAAFPPRRSRSSSSSSTLALTSPSTRPGTRPPSLALARPPARPARLSPSPTSSSCGSPSSTSTLTLALSPILLAARPPPLALAAPRLGALPAASARALTSSARAFPAASPALALARATALCAAPHAVAWTSRK